MKKIIVLLTLLLHAFAGFTQDAIPQPSPARLVVDYANLLSASEQASLEQKLVELDNNTSNQIVVLTVSTLKDMPIEDVAVKTFRSWGIGNKKTNNGILLLISSGDRKVKIEVGYGLEGAIPDVTAKDIINNSITPNFKKQQYYKGLNEAIDNLAKAATGEYKVKRTKEVKGKSGGSLIFIIMVIIVIILISGRGGRRGGGGGGMGLIAPLLFSGLGSSGGNNNSGGGFGGGGDFGGFGGGSSGGGGASGSW